MSPQSKTPTLDGAGASNLIQQFKDNTGQAASASPYLQGCIAAFKSETKAPNNEITINECA